MMVMKIQDEPSIVDDRWEKSYKGRKYQKLYNKRVTFTRWRLNAGKPS